MLQLTVASAQFWTTGNTNSGSGLKLGTFDQEDLKLYTYNIQHLTLKTDGKLGLGINNPRGLAELFYCNPWGSVSPIQQKTGLIVTASLCDHPFPDFMDFINPDIIGGNGVIEGYDVILGPSVPFSFLTGHSTNALSPLYSSTIAPLFWARVEDANQYANYSGPPRFDTKMIVMSDGSVGINIAQPRAALDVRGSQAPNRPAAIFGARALGTGGTSGPHGLFQYYTQQIQIIPNLIENGYNPISQAGDQGIFFTDGQGPGGSNDAGALVFAPWTAPTNNADVGGMRMDHLGNVEFHGQVRAMKVKVEAKWWSDFVFADNYRMRPLSEVASFIAQYKHLPDMPSENEVMQNGIDVAEMQAKQQQKIEELTLYIIQLEQRLKKLESHE